MSSTNITRRYRFSAAHWLPLVPETHKCHRIHGHNYKVDVTVALLSGNVEQDGLVMDFFDLDEIVEPLIQQVDHRTLNDIVGLANPSAELIALWFFNRLRQAVEFTKREIPLILQRVRVYEEDDCWSDVTRDVYVST